MKSDNVAIILQKPLQEAFDTECRCYEIYLKIYESLVKVWEELKKQKGELEEKKELDEKVSSYNQAFNSSEFDKIRKLVNLSDSVARNFISAFSMYEGMSDLEGKIDEVEYEKDTVSRLLKAFRERLHAIQANVICIIEYVKDANTKLEVSEKNPIAERLLISYYSDTGNFDYCRNIIEMEGCKLGESFMKAYCAEGYEEERKAVAWFEKEAKKYEI